MTESERLRKEMEERGLLGTTGKKVIVSAAQKEINEKKGGTAKAVLPDLQAGQQARTTDSAKHVPDTNLFRGMQLNRPTARKNQRTYNGKGQCCFAEGKGTERKQGLERQGKRKADWTGAKGAWANPRQEPFWPPSLETRRQRQESAK